MKFSIRTLLELMAAVAVLLAGWRLSRDSFEQGRDWVRLELRNNGCVKVPPYASLVPIGENEAGSTILLHIIWRVPRRPGVAVVEVWDTSTQWSPQMLRSYDVSIEHELD